MRTNTPKSSAPSHSLVSLVQGTLVEGTVEAESDIRVDGTIKGKLRCESKVIIGPSGYIEGEVYCQNAVVEGRLDGLLEVAELLNVRESAKLNGRVHTDKLIVQSGALFNVKCQMGQEAKPQRGNQPSEAAPANGKAKHSTTDTQAVGKEKQPTS